jgi:hypothetical protein
VGFRRPDEKTGGGTTEGSRGVNEAKGSCGVSDRGVGQSTDRRRPFLEN